MNQISQLSVNSDDQEQYLPYVKIRHQIHQYPELEGDTVNTVDLVKSVLEKFGYQIHSNIGGHGLVAVIKKGTSNRTIGIRADMDALPIVEANTFEHASKIHGRMHACGHDGHSAILLAAAELIATQGQFDGTVNLIFQPAEESLTGAKQMIEDGLFEKFPCDSVFALHNMPGIPEGHIVAQIGPAMASSEKITCILEGKGGHGAIPELANDPIIALGQFISAIQSIKSRNLPIADSAVISIGSIHAGTAYNIIPNQVEIQLNVRTDTEQVRSMINQRIEEILKGLEYSFKIKTQLDIQFLVPPVINAEKETIQVRDALTAHFGEDRVLKSTFKIMGSEDFAWMSNKVPGCYFMIGNGEGEFHGCSVHNPHYDFNDRIISVGAQSWLKIVEHALNVDG